MILAATAARHLPGAFSAMFAAVFASAGRGVAAGRHAAPGRQVSIGRHAAAGRRGAAGRNAIAGGPASCAPAGHTTASTGPDHV